MHNDCSTPKKPGRRNHKYKVPVDTPHKGKWDWRETEVESACGLKWWWLKCVSFAHFVQTFEHMVRVSPKTLEGTHASERHWSLIIISFMEGAVAVGTGTCGNYRKRTVPQKRKVLGRQNDRWPLYPDPLQSHLLQLQVPEEHFLSLNPLPQVPRWFSIQMSYAGRQGGCADLLGLDQSKP